MKNYEFDSDLLAEKIRQAIKDSGMSRRKVSKALHIGYGSICYWCQGRTFPSIDNLARFAVLTGHTVDWFCGLEWGNDI